MTETYVTWSPHGTYLGTFHRQGVILWGTEKWDKVMRFQHPGVKLLDFSPRENYLVTFSTQLSQYRRHLSKSLRLMDCSSIDFLNQER